MTHDEKCEGRIALMNYDDNGAAAVDMLCGCADRAIAKARREGRIEGVALKTDYLVPLADIVAEVDEWWPEDKP